MSRFSERRPIGRAQLPDLAERLSSIRACRLPVSFPRIAVTEPSGHLRVLDEPSVSRELDLVSELFHRINRIIPATQRLLVLSPDTTARDAIAQLRQHGYSQAPVVAGDEVLGVFSYRSFAKAIAAYSWQDLSQQKCAPGDLKVEEFLETFEFARVTAEMQQVFDAMDRDNGILIGSPEKLQWTSCATSIAWPVLL